MVLKLFSHGSSVDLPQLRNLISDVGALYSRLWWAQSVKHRKCGEHRPSELKSRIVCEVVGDRGDQSDDQGKLQVSK
ncbi:hypothetical protein KIN20_012704 [Parelaphostrongylus tenuis]|uniref:Uncharacterized protein n=1 Tax=Parelaphostrongylus tenuis TaxID=148309 RepID=A0AAD5MB09_PARTN|nr:hypothetical protein KIN20_012704 [Parelaphostrongylus tenuis]